jgi:putative PIN family toxin of toxin-antitoxin system
VRIVLDCNILVRSFSRPGGLADKVLFEVLKSKDTLILSNELLVEVARVLRYPRFMVTHWQDEEAIYNFTLALREGAEVVALNPLSLAPIRDQNDILILQTALSGQAEILCTCDRDFFEPPALDFLRHHGIDVMTDVDLMRRLRA